MRRYNVERYGWAKKGRGLPSRIYVELRRTIVRAMTVRKKKICGEYRMGGIIEYSMEDVVG